VTEGKQFPDNSLIVGAPARVVRTLDGEAAKMLTAASDSYVARWRQYASGLKRLA
jgi:carbonic anhydrase/acetyltransferase-like protein (isoleucine patch superfamily)